MEEEKTENEQEQPVKKSNLTEKIRENPWMLSTLVLGALVAILLVTTFSGGITGNVVSKEKAADNLINYLNTVADSPITLVSVENAGSMYLVTVSYQGQDIPVYLTKDGSYYTTALIPIASESSDTNQQAEVPKSNKPSVELYVFAYCPYGLQMEKATIPVVELFGDNIDFKIRQIGAMHGEFEKVEAERQLCIEKNYPDKFLNYVLAFAEDTSCTSGDVSCVTTKVNALYNKLGIDASKINSCMTSEGETLYNAEVSNANSMGISGSPTLVINGVEVQSSRSPEAVKGVICEAFNNVPSECTQTLSTSEASAGFGSGTSSGDSSAQC
jgi:protein-disulfide isomerase